MIDSIVLYFFLLAFLLLVNFENKFKRNKLTILSVREFLRGVSLKEVLPFIAYYLIVFVIVLIKDHGNLVKLYIYIVFGFAILFHFAWATARDKLDRKAFLSFFGLLIILFRILFPSTISHNLFIIFIASWLGPFITSFKFFSKRMFIFISVIWFIYDIFYVWISASYKEVTMATQGTGFPLGIISGNQLIGLADLFWVSICLSMIIDAKHRYYLLILFIVSDILLNIISTLTNYFSVFPLLVLWVPIGIIFLLKYNYAKGPDYTKRV